MGKVKKRTKLELRPQIADGIISDIAPGLGVSNAAVNAGISDQTIFNWLRRGEQGLVPFEGFARRYQQARVSPLRKALAAVMKAIEEGGLQATTWFLSKFDPTRFGDRLRLDTEVRTGPEYDLSRLTADELRTWRRLALKAEVEP